MKKLTKMVRKHTCTQHGLEDWNWSGPKKTAHCWCNPDGGLASWEHRSKTRWLRKPYNQSGGADPLGGSGKGHWVEWKDGRLLSTGNARCFRDREREPVSGWRRMVSSRTAKRFSDMAWESFLSAAWLASSVASNGGVDS